MDSLLSKKKILINPSLGRSSSCSYTLRQLALFYNRPGRLQYWLCVLYQLGSYWDRYGYPLVKVFRSFFKDSVLGSAGIGSLTASLFLNLVISQKLQNCLVI